MDCFSARLRAAGETSWDLGPFAAVLQCLHLDTHLLEQQNTKKPRGTKKNCVHGSWDKFWTKDTETTKTQLPLLKNLEQKRGVGSKS